MRLMPFDSLLLNARPGADAAVTHGRTVARAAARALDGARAPSHALAATTLKVNAVLHESVERLVDSQLRAWDGVLDESVRRLTVAADADGLRPLLAGQIGLMNDTRARIVEDARRTLGILADARAKLGAVFAAPAAHTPQPVQRASRPARKRAATATRAKGTRTTRKQRRAR
jgi:hypothetical protein